MFKIDRSIIPGCNVGAILLGRYFYKLVSLRINNLNA